MMICLSVCDGMPFAVKEARHGIWIFMGSLNLVKPFGAGIFFKILAHPVFKI